MAGVAKKKKKRTSRATSNDLIVSNPKVMVGKPCVRGTRITVELILDKLAAGETVDEILHDHPTLTVEGVRAAITFASNSLRFDTVYPIQDLAK